MSIYIYIYIYTNIAINIYVYIRLYVPIYTSILRTSCLIKSVTSKEHPSPTRRPQRPGNQGTEANRAEAKRPRPATTHGKKCRPSCGWCGIASGLADEEKTGQKGMITPPATPHFETPNFLGPFKSKSKSELTVVSPTLFEIEIDILTCRGSGVAPSGWIHFQKLYFFRGSGGAPAGGIQFQDFYLSEALELPLPGESNFRNLAFSRLWGCPCRGNPFSEIVFSEALELPLPGESNFETPICLGPFEIEISY